MEFRRSPGHLAGLAFFSGALTLVAGASLVGALAGATLAWSVTLPLVVPPALLLAALLGTVVARELMATRPALAFRNQGMEIRRLGAREPELLPWSTIQRLEIERVPGGLSLETRRSRFLVVHRRSRSAHAPRGPLRLELRAYAGDVERAATLAQEWLELRPVAGLPDGSATGEKSLPAESDGAEDVPDLEEVLSSLGR